MSKYKFRLATLQRLREVHRNEQRARLADAMRAEEALAERRAELHQELQDLTQMRLAAARTTPLDVGRLLDAQRYESVLKAHEQTLAGQEKLLAEEVARRRQALVEADREVRVLERLDERKREAHRHAEMALETKQLDEIAQQLQLRPRHSPLDQPPI